MLTSLFLTAAFLQVPAETVERGLPQGVVIGEISSDSVLIHARLTAAKPEGEGGVAGHFGSLSFSFIETQEPSSGDRPPMKVTSVLVAQAQNDFTVRERVEGLRPNTEYRWLAHGLKQGAVFGEFEPIDLGRGTFRTLPGKSASRPLNFVVTNCMNQHYFLNGGQGRPAYQGEDKALGFPGLEAIDELDPSFVVFAGDSVYYDRPQKAPATDAETMRAHWHRLFAQPRMRKLLASTATYWMKDDHDHRFDDSDRTGDRLPSHALGRKIFREQVPVVALDDDITPTWRTVRVSKDLQIWMTEGRDHRSPNATPDGPEKTLWGTEQRDWLKRTLLETDAAFKILISPTPMVGPDDLRKADNHTNPKGFRVEGEAFHAWLAEQKLNDRGFFVICGDRHWQYHSIHPQGTHEFAVGALLDSNARMGRKPGDAKSTDPDSRIRQPYTSREPSGGFLEVRLETEPELHLDLIFRDEHGVELHRVRRKP